MERKTLNVKETARILGVGSVTLYAAIKRGEIPHLRIGRRIVIPIESIDNLLKAQFNYTKPGPGSRKED